MRGLSACNGWLGARPGRDRHAHSSGDLWHYDGGGVAARIFKGSA